MDLNFFLRVVDINWVNFQHFIMKIFYYRDKPTTKGKVEDADRDTSAVENNHVQFTTTDLNAVDEMLKESMEELKLLLTSMVKLNLVRTKNNDVTAQLKSFIALADFFFWFEGPSYNINHLFDFFFY